MKKDIKKFIIGLLVICSLLITIPVFADSIIQKIDVVLNIVNVEVNDIKTDTDTILYNGVVYVPVRTVGGIFNKDIEWNQENMTVKIKDKIYEEVNKNEYNIFIESFDLKETKNVILNDKTYFYVEYLYNKDLNDKNFDEWINQHSENLNSYIKNAFEETGTYGVLNLILEFNRIDKDNNKYCIRRITNDSNGLFIE